MKPTFSGKILARKRDRRVLRFRIIVLSVAAICVITGQILMAHYAKKKANDVHLQTLMYDAPNWADFRRLGGAYSSVGYTTQDGIPSALLINGEQWSIIKVNQFSYAFGKPIGSKTSGAIAETYCGRNTIAYIQHEDLRDLRISLWHEVFHAGACIHGGDSWWSSENNTADHPGIYHLGVFQYTFMHDNPQFVLWALN